MFFIKISKGEINNIISHLIKIIKGALMIAIIYFNNFH